MPLGPTCPACARRVPFLKTQWGLGTPFRCAGCDAALIVPKTSLVLLLVLFTAFWMIRDRIPASWGGQLGLLAALVVIGPLVTWAVTRVRLAQAD